VNEAYRAYITSPEWRKKRWLRLNHDRHRCRTCWQTEQLEVHHCTYERFGDERVDDLITLCRPCHEAITAVIRARRAAKVAPVQRDVFSELAEWWKRVWG
jgi:5-methylcytosine-specific restriction endonuclease McrA